MTIAIVALFLPILLSIFRFIPGLTRSPGWSRLNSLTIHPATFGKHHREPVAGGVVPTRGQSLYIFLISLLNIVLLVAPYTIHQPQASFLSKGNQLLSIIGNRAGVMAMGNVVALFVFSSRNSVILYLTDWSYGTYLLLHRWLGYWAVLHTVIHSAMLWSYYVKAGTYSAEILRLYWIWGSVGTVAACAIVPFSILWIRQKFYEFFLVLHIALSLLFLLGYYYHIWYVYTYNWGYEIWMFVAAGIWAVERLIRIYRMAYQGSRTAIGTMLPGTDGEYLQIEVEGKELNGGVAYLCFPTLSWRFWETHPFSVSGVVAFSQQGGFQTSRSTSSYDSSPTPEAENQKEPTVRAATSQSSNGVSDPSPSGNTTFFARTRGGVTKALAEKASNADTYQVRVRVLIDGPYDHSGRVHSQIAQCSSFLCIAGGVGITACLALLRQSELEDVKVFWSSRKAGLVEALTPTLDSFGSRVKVETLVGQRFDLEAIVREALTSDGGSGPLAIMVSGPPGLSDDVRMAVTQTARSCKLSRPFVLIDEAFGW